MVLTGLATPWLSLNFKTDRPLSGDPRRPNLLIHFKERALFRQIESCVEEHRFFVLTLRPRAISGSETRFATRPKRRGESRAYVDHDAGRCVDQGRRSRRDQSAATP